VNKRGVGRVYLRGSIYWIRYWHRGREYRESSGSDREALALKLLKQRLAQMGAPRFIGPAEERLSFEDLADMLRRDYVVNGRRSLKKIEGCLNHLRRHFGLFRGVDISADRIKAYVVERREEGAANATVNRELAALKRAFSLAVEEQRLGHAPKVSMLEEHNARQGFLDHAEFVVLRDYLPDHLKDPITFLYFSGWRVGEMRALEWREVDIRAAQVSLRAEHSKNKRPRVLPLAGELKEIIERAQNNRRLDCPRVFHHDGRPIGSFRKTWATARRRAGLGGLLVHDFRRTTVRNLVRAGVPEKVAMEITGHKTRAVFERYNIVSDADRRAAVERLEAHLQQQSHTPKIAPLVGGDRGED